MAAGDNALSRTNLKIHLEIYAFSEFRITAGISVIKLVTPAVASPRARLGSLTVHTQSSIPAAEADSISSASTRPSWGCNAEYPLLTACSIDGCQGFFQHSRPKRKLEFKNRIWSSARESKEEITQFSGASARTRNSSFRASTVRRANPEAASSTFTSMFTLSG